MCNYTHTHTHTHTQYAHTHTRTRTRIRTHHAHKHVRAHTHTHIHTHIHTHTQSTRRYFLAGKKLQNGKTNKWQAASKVGVTGDIFFHPSLAKENWNGNEIDGLTRGLKRVNPLRLLLRHVMLALLHKNETENGAYSCSRRESTWLLQAWLTTIFSIPSSFLFASVAYAKFYMIKRIRSLNT